MVMTMLLGADSASRFSAPAALAAGYKVGARYINQSFNAVELREYLDHGLVLLPIYEESGRPGSFADGQRQGKKAKSILEALGIGDYGCAFTDDVSGASFDVVRDWVRGIRSTFPNHLVYYGPSHHGDRLVEEGHADSVWIEGAWSFSPGYNQNNPKPPKAKHACGTQFPNQPTIGGVTVDYNEFVSTPWLPGHAQLRDDTDLDYAKWTPEEQWSQGNAVANLVTGVDVQPVNGRYEGQRPARANTIAGVQERLGAAIFEQTRVNVAVLTKLGVPFHMDKGAIVLD